MPLTEREIIQHQLKIIHQHTHSEEVKYMATIRVNVATKWNATKTFIEGLRRIDDAATARTKTI